MKKKLISLVCALSMIVALFSSFTIVNAATPSLVGTASKEGNKVTVTITYDGFTKVSAAQFKLPVDTTKFNALNKATDVSVAVSGGVLVDNYDAASNTYIFGWSGLNADTWLNGSGTLATVTLTLKDDTTKAPKTLSLEDGYIKDQTDAGAVEYRPVAEGNVQKLTVDEVKVVDPDSKDPQDRPKTSDEDEPTTPVVVEGAQIKGEATLSKDGKTAEVVITYDGFTKVSAAQFKFPVDTTKFNALNKATDVSVAVSGGVLVDNYDAASNTYIFGWSGLNADTWLNGSGTLATITLTLKDGVKLPVDLSINDGYIKDQTDAGAVEYRPVAEGNVQKLGVVNPTVKGEETSSYDKEGIKLGDDILKTTTTGDDDVKSTDDKVNPYYVAITATKADGSPAKYDEDYTAYYNGTKLTEGQLNNYLAGKYGKVSDALKNITFSANKGVTISAELDKVEDGEASIIKNGDVTVPTKGGNATPKPTPTPTMSIVTTVGGKVTNKVTEKSILTAIVDVPEKLQVGGAYLLDYLDVDKEGYLELISSKVDEGGLRATYKYQALKAGKVTLTASYVADEDDGDDDTNLTPTKTTTLATAKTTVQITKEPDSSPSSPSDKSTSSGGGAIALGNQKGTTGNYPGTTTNFPDIEGVASWAGPAITRLAAEGIVAGRDDGTFDPDANITRAEYCQMLVQTISKSGVYADVNYDDVPTDAWFYHAVAVASSLGIVEGFGDNTFHPYELITREQMARMTMAATQVQGIYFNNVQSVSFSDDADIADWSRDSVYTLAEAGVINGMDDGSYFAPRANATRAQAAVIIYKAFFEGK